ncbi:MAG: hypothetical protein KGI60_04325 [Patescibacteria group bacterium]|nr:hypothetical protein [Patescibacteria group bacterium]
MKSTRKVTYRRWGIPAVILEGKWLTKKFGWTIGDLVNVTLQPESITLTKSTETKNSPKGAPGNLSTSSLARPSEKSIAKNHGNKPKIQPAGGAR